VPVHIQVHVELLLSHSGNSGVPSSTVVEAGWLAGKTSQAAIFGAAFFTDLAITRSSELDGVLFMLRFSILGGLSVVSG
jgi:hypothetical protein